MSQAAVIHSNGHPSYLENTGKYSGIRSWIFSTDHKRIGILYLTSLLSFFAVGVAFGFLMRLELLTPGKTIMDPQTYNSILYASRRNNDFFICNTGNTCSVRKLLSSNNDWSKGCCFSKA